MLFSQLVRHARGGSGGTVRRSTARDDRTGVMGISRRARRGGRAGAVHRRDSAGSCAPAASVARQEGAERAEGTDPMAGPNLFEWTGGPDRGSCIASLLVASAWFVVGRVCPFEEQEVAEVAEVA